MKLQSFAGIIKRCPSGAALVSQSVSSASGERGTCALELLLYAPVSIAVLLAGADLGLYANQRFTLQSYLSATVDNYRNTLTQGESLSLRDIGPPLQKAVQEAASSTADIESSLLRLEFSPASGRLLSIRPSSRLSEKQEDFLKDYLNTASSSVPHPDARRKRRLLADPDSNAFFESQRLASLLSLSAPRVAIAAAFSEQFAALPDELFFAAIITD